LEDKERFRRERRLHKSKTKNLKGMDVEMCSSDDSSEEEEDRKYDEKVTSNFYNVKGRLLPHSEFSMLNR
jgi:hypothetical protein